MVDLLFISSNADREHASTSDHKRAVRSHAMRDFRRRQREGNAIGRASASEASGKSHTGRNKRPHVAETRGCSASEDQALQPTASAHLIRCETDSEKQTPHAGRYPTPNARWQSRCTSIQPLTAPAIPKSISWSAITRMPLVEAVVEGFFPHCVWKSPALEQGFKYWASPRSAAMQQINDSIGLLQLGTKFGDSNFKLEGQRRQLLAVQLLNNELRQSGFGSKTASNAIITLMVSEVFSAVSSGSAGHAVHLTGLTSILEAQVGRFGAESLDPLVLKHYSRLVLMQALIDRKAIHARQRALTDHMYFSSGTVEALLSLALRLPDILELKDLSQSERSQDRLGIDAKETLGIAVCLNVAFEDWLFDYELDLTGIRREACDFHSFLDANALCLYWCLKVLLLECLEHLQDLAGTPGNFEHGTVQTQTPVQNWSKQTDTYAALLLDACQAALKFEGSALSIAYCIRAPYHFARSRWSRLVDKDRVQTVLELEDRLRWELSSFDWDVLLYWSFFPLPWLA